ncbi:MAG TPA: ABC transporter permease, partial [Spirochaetia bacterium]|nr:ABC transporter permease [Spirochaetia bacterium]
PLTLAPTIIRKIASANPFSYDVTAARALFLGNFSEGAVLVAFVSMILLAAIAFIWAARTFRRGAA